MASFGRGFPIKCLSDVVLRENEWLRDMLCYWHPSGDAIGQSAERAVDYHLRLAIRNGYLNFYRAGQSVAKVKFDHGKIQAEIHKKYVYGDDCGEQGYVKLTSEGFPKRETARATPYDVARLRKWISRADSHSGAEKCFVDVVVSWNPNVIDLEMGLPAYSGERTAPRMDLVGLEPAGDQWRVVFWEAKLVTNPDARCQDGKVPKVMSQLEKYTNWLGHGNHQDLVAQAYQRTCQLLVDLHAVARRYRSDIEGLGPGIRAVAALSAPPPLIDKKPRLLIDAYTRIDTSFTKNGHLQKLLDTGLHVQMVHNLDQMTLKARP